MFSSHTDKKIVGNRHLPKSLQIGLFRLSLDDSGLHKSLPLKALVNLAHISADGPMLQNIAFLARPKNIFKSPSRYGILGTDILTASNQVSSPS